MSEFSARVGKSGLKISCDSDNFRHNKSKKPAYFKSFPCPIGIGPGFAVHASHGPLKKVCASVVPMCLVSQDRKPTILIADDEDTIRDLLKVFLCKSGFDVIATRNGAEAVTAFRSSSEPIDLVLMDIRMPVMDGVKALGLMQAANPNVRCCFFSSMADNDVEDLLKRGALRIFTKPFGLAELADSLWKLALKQ